MVMTKNENNKKCPPKIVEAAEIAQNILKRAIEQLENGRDTSQFWGRFVDKNKAQMLQAMKDMQTQLRITLSHGEVIPKNPKQEEESKGYRYELHPDDGIHAYTLGEGDGALITITSNAGQFSQRGLAWQWLHETSHATPSLTTMDYAYVKERIFPYLKSLGKSNNADSVVAAIFSIEGVDQPKEKRFEDEKDSYKDLSEAVKNRVKKLMAIADKGITQLVAHKLTEMQEIVSLKEEAREHQRDYQLQGTEKEDFDRMAAILTDKKSPTLSQIKEGVNTAKDAYNIVHLLCFGEPQQFCKASDEEETTWLKVEDLVEKRYIWGVYASVLTGTESARATQLLATFIEQDKDSLLIKGWSVEAMAKLAIKFYEKW